MDYLKQIEELFGPAQKGAAHGLASSSVEIPGFYLYSVFRSGELIYVGITKQLGKRFYIHLKDRIEDTDDVYFWERDSIEHARISEAVAINVFLPLLNEYIPRLELFTETFGEMLKIAQTTKENMR